MNRRDFFRVVTAAVVAVSAGIALRDDQKKLIARYRRAFDMATDRWVHRFDVRANGNVFYVDGMTEEEVLQPFQVEDMIRPLEALIGQEVTVAM